MERSTQLVKPRRIPTRELKVGMTVWNISGYDILAHPIWKKDVTLKHYFTTSPKLHTLSFITESGGRVIWHDCGYVYITT